MSTFLTICNDVARESGTFSNRPALSTTVDQTGRKYDVVEWVKQAYEDLQRSQRTWRWLITDFSASLAADTREYTAADFALADRFSHWVTRDEGKNLTFSFYLTATGRAGEQILPFVDYDVFRTRYNMGPEATQTGQPSCYSIDNQNRIVIYPIPDDAYTLRGQYYKSPQVLAGNTTEPEMPEQFHRLIQWDALRLLGTFDEAFNQIQLWERKSMTLMSHLISDQAPAIRRARPLA